MKVFYSLPSPFAAKVRMAARLCDIELDAVAMDTSKEPDELLAANPVGKIPTVLLDDGTAIYDSRVICEYFDRQSGNLLIPQSSEAWLKARRIEALADAVCDAGILCSYEVRYRPEEKRHQPWVDKQWRRVLRTLDALELEVPSLSDDLDIGQIALAATLGWLEVRFPGEWNVRAPQLKVWIDAFADRHPGYAELMPRPLT